MESVLKQYFGYEQFRPLQKDIIERTMQDKDSVVLMPTGGGKSLCFQLPALMKEGTAIVVSPLISLMKDQVDSLTTNGIAADLINSTLTPKRIQEVMEQTAAGKLKILYIAPERLSVPGFEDFLHALNISLIAIDEAHCISEWGHDFRPDYRNLKSLRTKFPKVPIMALTATATEAVRKDIVSQLSLNDYQLFISSFNRPNLSYQVIPKKDSFGSILNLLGQDKNKSTIIYCFSRNDTEALAAKLNDHGFKAATYHAGLTGKQRKEHQEQFINDEINIMVATIAFGMGIDKPDVRLVIHHTLPKTIEGYYQETGRAGRDGLPAQCVLLFSYADKFKHDFFLRNMRDEYEREKAEENIQKVLDYGNLRTCRRAFLLNYFNEPSIAKTCNNCDRCLPQVSPVIQTATRKRSFLQEVEGRSNEENSYDQALFEQLRQLRTSEAERLHVPPYVVFGDKALMQMAAQFPQTPAAFMDIYGVGQQKLDQFGKQFMAVIRAYVAKHGAVSPVIPVTPQPVPTLAATGETYQETKKLVAKQFSIQDIATIRNLSPDTILSHIEKIAATDNSLDLTHLKPELTRFETIAAAFKQTGGPALNPVRQILGEDYSYEELRRARLFLRN